MHQDFSKALEIAPPGKLLIKMEKSGISRSGRYVQKWLQNRQQGVAMKGDSFGLEGDSLGSGLGTTKVKLIISIYNTSKVLYNIFIYVLRTKSRNMLAVC